MFQQHLTAKCVTVGKDFMKWSYLIVMTING